jgi:PIN domain nuclease of toxin-antitoxin system
MNLLLDTHILLWAAAQPEKLSEDAKLMLLASTNQLFFSAASLWEITIKLGLARADFNVNPGRLLRLLIANGYKELAVNSTHALAVNELPAIHKDPFDRILLAQARSEGLTLLTADALVAEYGTNVKLI